MKMNTACASMALNTPVTYWVKLDQHTDKQAVFIDAVIPNEAVIGSFPWLQANNHGGGGTLPYGGNATYADGHGAWLAYNAAGKIWTTSSTWTNTGVMIPNGTGVLDYYGSSSAATYYFGGSCFANPLRGTLTSP